MINNFSAFGRYRTLVVAPAHLLAPWTEGAVMHGRCTQGIPPEGGQLVRIDVAPGGTAIAFTFSHPDWDLVPEGHQIPPLMANIQSIQPPAAPGTRPSADIGLLSRDQILKLLPSSGNGRINGDGTRPAGHATDA